MTTPDETRAYIAGMERAAEIIRNWRDVTPAIKACEPQHQLMVDILADISCVIGLVRQGLDDVLGATVNDRGQAGPQP